MHAAGLKTHEAYDGKCNKGFFLNMRLNKLKMANMPDYGMSSLTAKNISLLTKQI